MFCVWFGEGLIFSTCNELVTYVLRSIYFIGTKELKLLHKSVCVSGIAFRHYTEGASCILELFATHPVEYKFISDWFTRTITQV